MSRIFAPLSIFTIKPNQYLDTGVLMALFFHLFLAVFRKSLSLNRFTYLHQLNLSSLGYRATTTRQPLLETGKIVKFSNFEYSLLNYCTEVMLVLSLCIKSLSPIGHGR